MLLTICNLPAQTRYNDIKALIFSKCGLKDIILDNLTAGGNNTKKVTVGLAAEEDAAILARKLNGLFLDGQQLFVEPIKKKQPQAQPQESIYTQYVLPMMGIRADNVMPSNMVAECQPNLQQPYYQQSYQQDYQYAYPDNTGQNMMTAVMSGMPGAQNTLANYGYPQQMQYQSTSQMTPLPTGNFGQRAPLGFNDQPNESSWSDQNDWNAPDRPSAGDRNPQRNASRWDDPGDRDTRPNRDVPSREQGRDRSARDSRRETSSREQGRDRPRDSRRRDSPRRHERDARDRGRDAPSGNRRRGGQSPSRDRRRDAPIRSDRRRDAPARDRGRDDFGRHGSNAPPRDRARDVPAWDRNNARDQPTPQQTYGRDTFDRNQAYDPYVMDAPPPPTISQQNVFGDHVAKPNAPPGNFSLQRNGPKPKPTAQYAAQPHAFKQERQDKYVPPNKRPRPGVGATNFAGPPAKVPKPNTLPFKREDDPEYIARRTKTWRSQVASAIAKEILQKKGIANKIDIGLDILLPELKRAVRERLDNMFGDNYAFTMPVMMAKYKAKYPPNTEYGFYKHITILIKENLAKEALEPKQEGAEEKPAFTPEQQEKLLEAVRKPQPPLKKIEPQQTPKQIPSYPLGDKKLNHLEKDKCKKIFIDAEILYSRLEKKQRVAMDQVIDDMCKEIQEDLKSEEPEADFKMCHERACTELVGEINKIVKINMAKRLLNEGPILVRIFCQPKMISRGRLGPILSGQGITSLRKSDGKRPLPMYIGSCDTYDVLDKLITMEPLVVDESTITFKAFQLGGKPDKLSRQQILEQNKNRRETFEHYSQIVKEYNTPVKEENQNPETQQNENEDQANIKIETHNESAGSIEQDNHSNDVAASVNNVNNQITEENNQDIDFTQDIDQNNLEHDGWTSENVDDAWAGFEETGNTENLTAERDGNDETANLDSQEVMQNDNIDDIDIADVNDDDLEDW